MRAHHLVEQRIIRHLDRLLLEVAYAGALRQDDLARVCVFAAFDDIQKAGDISPTVVAGGMKVALLTTLFGIIVALVLQVFYNYVLSKIESLTALMEDSTISLLDICTKYNVKKNK